MELRFKQLLDKEGVGTRSAEYSLALEKFT